MLDITIKDSRPVSECDLCSKEYKEKYGCNLGHSSTDISACQIEHSRYRWCNGIMQRFCKRE